MDFFKAQFDRITQQLASLTPSQKMLTAAMVAIMVMTLVWWGRYAGEPEMEPLLPQAISADELPRVEMELEARGIRHAMSGDKLLVPSDRKLEAVAGLMYSHALPRNARDGFEDVLKNINPFMSESEASNLWNRGKQTTVSQIIADFPDVANAQVIIDPMREVRIGGGIEPSATVTISMRSGIKASQQLVDAAADVVQGAQSSLSRNKIKVVVDGSPRRLRQDSSDGGLFADDQQEAIQHEEVRLEDKIKNQLSYIPGLMASVTVKLNTMHLVENITAFDPKASLQKESQTTNKTQETTGASSGGGEPGVGANAPLSVNGGPAVALPGATSNTEENTAHFENFVGHTVTQRTNAGGDTTPVAAAVRVPLTYFAAIYTRQNPTVKDPTEKQMRGLIDEQLLKIRHDVMACTALKQDTDVAVETYIDPTALGAPPQVVAAGGGMWLAMLGGGHIKEGVLGAMALLSLFMVSMMVKKGAIVPVVATPVSAGAAAGGPVVPERAGFKVIPEDVGEAGEGNATLDGMELDDDTVRTQQMLEQVSNLVKEDPESAAKMVKRWMNRA
ncbi:MAG TPA: flagellar M-ring protein FliF C-terminal domain-containing protein [Tepidisphaeraceae bacterium]|jgi:flagellar biosynthesis/type III secretory pathway M-ring protein FliF/YscJ|nr:flagellar M-ring protein FliF C-terminal domain-containing protein [Tepidisphaeraceae bacterium]